MAWLSDEEFELRKDCREKKSIAASAHKQRTHCGKSGCMLPSDFMTKKEIKAMNGECVTYNMKKPMHWDVFKSMHDELKKEYVEFIRGEFGAPDRAIAEMFGIHPVSLGKHFKMLGLTSGEKRSGKTKWDQYAFDVWRGAILELPEVPVVENTPETPVEPAGEEIDIPVESEVVEENAPVHDSVERKRRIPGSGKMTFDGPIEEIVETLQMLLGGAEVTLDVAWTVIEKE